MPVGQKSAFEIMFFDSKRALGENCERTVAGGVGSPKVNIFACRTRCVRYARETSWFFALTSSFPVFPVSFRRRAKYTAGVSRSDVKIKIT